MPNRSKKKHIQPKKLKVKANEFAHQFVVNVGNKSTAYAKALHYRDSVKENKDLYNFWDNMAGHINKVKYV